MKILIAGDYCPVLRVAEQFEQNNYASVLGEIKTVVDNVDYSIVNLECPVVFGGEKPIKKCGPNLYCSEHGVEALKWAGFNCVTLANNHFNDFGEEGVKNTLQACFNNGIDTVGGGANLVEASEILYKNISDKKIAIINCCEHEFSIATKTSAGSNPLNPIKQFYAIKEAQKEADFVIVIVHGGHEHFQLPSPRMVDTYRFFIDAGADAVVNHHQHCYSGYEEYNGKLIFYGLGNFCFDDKIERNTVWNEGFLVVLDFEQEKLSYEIIPYKQCTDNPSITVLNKDAYKQRFDFINDIISDSDKLDKEINEYYKGSSLIYQDSLEPIQNRFYLAAKSRKLLPSFLSKKKILKLKNFIFCESHQDKLKWWINENLE